MCWVKQNQTNRKRINEFSQSALFPLSPPLYKPLQLFFFQQFFLEGFFGIWSMSNNPFIGYKCLFMNNCVDQFSRLYSCGEFHMGTRTKLSFIIWIISSKLGASTRHESFFSVLRQSQTFVFHLGRAFFSWKLESENKGIVHSSHNQQNYRI